MDLLPVSSCSGLLCLQLLAVFMRMDTCSLLRTYVRQSRRSDLLLTFDALLVRAPPTCRRGREAG